MPDPLALSVITYNFGVAVACWVTGHREASMLPLFCAMLVLWMALTNPGG